LGDRKDIQPAKETHSTNPQRLSSGTGGEGGPEREPADRDSPGKTDAK